MKRKDDETDLDHHLNMMLEAVERLERNRWPGSGGRRWPGNAARPPLMPVQAELRTLELWRSVMAECLATFLYVAVVCGAATSDASPVLGAAAASGFTMLALTVCLQNVSGNFAKPDDLIPKTIRVRRFSLQTRRPDRQFPFV